MVMKNIVVDKSKDHAKLLLIWFFTTISTSNKMILSLCDHCVTRSRERLCLYSYRQWYIGQLHCDITADYFFSRNTISISPMLKHHGTFIIMVHSSIIFLTPENDEAFRKMNDKKSTCCHC